MIPNCQIVLGIKTSASTGFPEIQISTEKKLLVICPADRG
jgi:hypothetical protein